LHRLRGSRCTHNSDGYGARVTDRWLLIVVFAAAVLIGLVLVWEWWRDWTRK